MNVNQFQQINILYNEYYSLLSQANMENKLQILKDKIIIEVCRIFYLPDDEKSLYITEKRNHINKKANEEYSYEIVTKIIECLKTFSRKEFDSDIATMHKEKNFSNYVYTSVKKRLGYLKAHKKVKDNNQMEIPREKIDLIRKIQKQEQNLLGLIKNHEKRANKIKQLLNISDSDFEILYPMAQSTYISLDTPIGNEQEITLIDLQPARFPSNQDLIENKEALKWILDKIQEHWERSDSLLSELLTIDILSTMFGNSKTETAISNAHDVYENYSIFQNYSFIKQDILYRFFHDLNYALPTQTETGSKYNVGKSGISKKLSRFYEKLKQTN